MMDPYDIMAANVIHKGEIDQLRYKLAIALVTLKRIAVMQRSYHDGWFGDTTMAAFNNCKEMASTAINRIRMYP